MTKRFPIIHIPDNGPKEPGVPGFTIPWAMAEKAYEIYVRLIGKNQTLERIAERGGFTWFEFVLLYCDQGTAWTEVMNIDKEFIWHCTQHVVADLLTWEEEAQ